MSFISFNRLNTQKTIYPKGIEKEKNQKIEFNPTEIKDEFVSCCDHSENNEKGKFILEGNDSLLQEERHTDKIRRPRIMASSSAGSNFCPTKHGHVVFSGTGGSN